MFDSFHTHSHHSSVTVEKTVREQRAPTDESVRLLHEMEKAAMDKVVSAIRVSDSLFEAVLHQHVDHLNCQKMFMCVIKLNGEKITVPFNCDDWASREEIAIGIRDAIANEIANRITSSITRILSNSNE